MSITVSQMEPRLNFKHWILKAFFYIQAALQKSCFIHIVSIVITTGLNVK